MNDGVTLTSETVSSLTGKKDKRSNQAATKACKSGRAAIAPVEEEDDDESD